MRRFLATMTMAAALLASFTAMADHEGTRRHRNPRTTEAPTRSAPSLPTPQNAETLIRVAPPQQGSVTIADGDVVLSRTGVGAALSVRTGKTYDILATRGANVLWRGSIQATGGTIELTWTDSATPTMRVVPPVVAVPVPFPGPGTGPFEAPRPRGMKDDSFEALVALLDDQRFESDKLDVVKSAASRNRFTTAQVGRIVDLLTFSSDKIEAVKALRPRIVDPENGFTLAKHFTFSSDKETVTALFVPSN